MEIILGTFLPKSKYFVADKGNFFELTGGQIKYD